ncbi:uncharacterized protein [Amphiura filiformis]|uniref:uncharacterized protein n=1 Tax=Amphiura filiformis TaxID=82378 RepID=UPI003B211594
MDMKRRKKKQKQVPKQLPKKLQDSSTFFSSDDDEDGGRDVVRVNKTYHPQRNHEDEDSGKVEDQSHQSSHKQTDENVKLQGSGRLIYSSDEDFEDHNVKTSGNITKSSKTRKPSKNLGKASKKSVKKNTRKSAQSKNYESHATKSSGDAVESHIAVSTETLEIEESESKSDSGHESEDLSSHSESDGENKSQTEADEIITSTTGDDYQDAPKERQTRQYYGYVLCLVTVLLLLLYLVTMASWLTWDLDEKQKDHVEPQHFRFRLPRFKKHMAKLQQQFPSQNYRLWDVIGGACQSHIKNPPDLVNPVIILLAGSTGSATTFGCLATSLAFMFDDILQASQNPIIINGTVHHDEDSGETKSKIHDQMTTGFTNLSKSAVIHNLDDLPPCSVIIFHSYCDNEFAPFKDAAIIHTVQVETNSTYLHALSPKDFDKVVSNHLRNCWEPCKEHMTPDKQDAMLSRVANNIALVMPESDIELVGNCT